MRYLPILLISLLSFSCGHQKADPKKAHEFYAVVAEQISGKKDIDQEFIDKMAAALTTAKEDSTAVINIDELKTLFLLARKNNEEQLTRIEALEEVDNAIGVKKKVLQYLTAFNEAYHIEFPYTIEMLNANTDDRLERINEKLFPKLLAIKNLQVEMDYALNSFQDKYEDKAAAEPRRTGENYEFVKLKDFIFSPATIKEGTKIELLSFSGGDDLRDGKLYYKQFIGIDKTTGDTVRILAIASMQHYDLDKAPRIGSFTKDISIRDQMAAGDLEYIIFNKELADIEKGNYKTAFGILKFDE